MSVAAEEPIAETTIVLVDDHAIVRQGLRSVLEREPDLRIVGEAADPETAQRLVREVRPAVVLLDLKLSSSADAQGIELCADLVGEHPDLGVLVLTTFLDDAMVLAAVRVGAKGYVVKDVDTTGLVRAIRDVSRGGSAFDARSAAAMVRGLNAPQPSGAEAGAALTEREQEVLALLARGHSNRTIGEQLFVSETTAKFHVGNILRKLGVSRRAEAVYEATKRGWV